MLELKTPLPVKTSRGDGLALFVTDRGIEHDLEWTVVMDNTGECWTFKNPEIRFQKNITWGRTGISPFYNPDDVVFDAD